MRNIGLAHRVPMIGAAQRGLNWIVRRFGSIPLRSTMLVLWALALTAGATAQMSPYLEKFVDPLPKPAVMQPVATAPGFKAYAVDMMEVEQKLHRDLPPTRVWTYNGTFPGATFETRQGELTRVTWTCNGLPLTHLLPVDMTLPDTMHEHQEVRVVPHRHGGLQDAEVDGPPDSWFSPSGDVGPEYVTNVYDYPNDQPPATLWYHDHTGGLTRLNVYAGLAGFWLIRNDFEDNLNLPKGDYEIPLAIQDRTFMDDGSGDLWYPPVGRWPKLHPVWVKHFHGDTAVVNGVVWPYLEVEPRKYRFRLLNGCNARRLELKLSPGVSFYQIGGDTSLLPSPVRVSGLKLDPGERADIVIDFKNYKGQNILLVNNETGDGHDLYQIMQFRVKNLTVQDPSTVPAVLQPLDSFVERNAAKVRDLSFAELQDEHGDPIAFLLDGKFRHEPVTEIAKKNTFEIWRIINLTSETHPIHPHLSHIRVLDRQPCDTEAYAEALAAYRAGSGPKPVLENFLTGKRVGPRKGETGYKDTVQSDAESVTRIAVFFDEYTGNTVWHCHILEHEDNDMMRPLLVTD